MARTPQLAVRMRPELIEAARKGAGFLPTASAGEVIRFALAVIAGEPDPKAVAAPGPRGPHRLPDSELAALAREAYRTSLARGEPIARAELVRRFSIPVYKARQIVADCKAEHQAVA
jgi:hypothetical protein